QCVGEGCLAVDTVEHPQLDLLHRQLDRHACLPREVCAPPAVAALLHRQVHPLQQGRPAGTAPTRWKPSFTSMITALTPLHGPWLPSTGRAARATRVLSFPGLPTDRVHRRVGPPPADEA